MPHIAYAVDELEPCIAGKEIAIAPFDVGDPPFARVAFIREDGVIAEYMEFKPGVPGSIRMMTARIAPGSETCRN